LEFHTACGEIPSQICQQREKKARIYSSQVSLELPLCCGEERVPLIEKANSGGRKKEKQRGCRAQPARERERERMRRE